MKIPQDIYAELFEYNDNLDIMLIEKSSQEGYGKRSQMDIMCKIMKSMNKIISNKITYAKYKFFNTIINKSKNEIINMTKESSDIDYLHYISKKYKLDFNVLYRIYKTKKNCGEKSCIYVGDNYRIETCMVTDYHHLTLINNDNSEYSIQLEIIREYIDFDLSEKKIDMMFALFEFTLWLSSEIILNKHKENRWIKLYNIQTQIDQLVNDIKNKKLPLKNLVLFSKI